MDVGISILVTLVLIVVNGFFLQNDALGADERHLRAREEPVDDDEAGGRSMCAFPALKQSRTFGT